MMLASDRDRGGFWHGACAGFACCVVLGHLVYSSTLGDLRGLYRDFGAVALPLLTRITIHPAWIWGAPLAGLAAVSALLLWRPRGLRLYVVTAVLVLIVAAASYWYPRAPMRELAGSITDG